MWYNNQASGRLTQLGECLLDVEEVTGSSPVLSTNRTVTHLGRNGKGATVVAPFSISPVAVTVLYLSTIQEVEMM